MLDAVVSAARKFCGADDATIVMRDGRELVMANHQGSLNQLLGERVPLDSRSTMSLKRLSARIGSGAAACTPA